MLTLDETKNVHLNKSNMESSLDKSLRLYVRREELHLKEMNVWATIVKSKQYWTILQLAKFVVKEENINNTVIQMKENAAAMHMSICNACKWAHICGYYIIVSCSFNLSLIVILCRNVTFVACANLSFVAATNQGKIKEKVIATMSGYS